MDCCGSKDERKCNGQSILELKVSVKLKMEVIELAFKDRCQTGVKAVNRLLKDGFTIHSQFPNDAGIVVELIKWGEAR